MSYDVNKLTKLAALKALAEKVSEAIPTKVSQLSNDSNFQTSTQVAQAIQTAISKAGHASFQKVDAVPDVSTAQENILYLVMNQKTKHYDIYAKVENEVLLLDDTTVDLTGYVQKDGNKVLSDNNFSNADKTKLDGIAEGANNYTHPSHTAHESGLYKVTVDGQGHVTAAVAVQKTDITGLGIPGKDTTYTPAVAGGADGLLTGADKQKLGGIAANATKVEKSATNGNIKINGAETQVYKEPSDVVHGSIASTEDVTAMLTEVFGA